MWWRVAYWVPVKVPMIYWGSNADAPHRRMTKSAVRVQGPGWASLNSLCCSEHDAQNLIDSMQGVVDPLLALLLRLENRHF